MSALGLAKMSPTFTVKAFHGTERKLLRRFTKGYQIDVSNCQYPERIVQARSVKKMLKLASSSDGLNAIQSLHMKGAVVQGELDLSYESVPLPLIFESCAFTDSIVMRGTRVPLLIFRDCDIALFEGEHSKVAGDLNLRGSRVSQLNLEGADISNDLHLSESAIGGVPESLAVSTVVDARGIKIHGNLDCEHLLAQGRVNFEDANVDGSVYLNHADLECDGASDDAMAFNGQGLTVGSQFVAHQMRAKGRVSLTDLKCPGPLEFHGATLTRSNSQEEALCLDRCKTDASVFCSRSFRAEGVLHAIGMEVGGSLVLRGACVGQASCSDPSRQVLIIDRSVIKGGIIASPGVENPDPFIAYGPISLNAVRVTGSVILEGVSAIGTCSLAMMEVAGELKLGADGFCSYRRGEAAIDLTGTTTGTLRLEGSPSQGLVDLTGVRAEFFMDNPTDYVLSNNSGRTTEPKIILNGLTYGRIHQSNVKLSLRIAWVCDGTRKVRTSDAEYVEPAEGYVPQPWEQLAAAYRRLGLGRDARTILLHAERARNRAIHWRARTLRWKAWNYAQDWTIGYGYRPVWVFYWIFIMLALGWGYFSTHNPSPSISTGNGRFSLFDTVAYPVDLLLPLDFGGRAAWHPIGALGTGIALLLAVAGWILSLTVVIGITRAMRE